MQKHIYNIVLAKISENKPVIRDEEYLDYDMFELCDFANTRVRYIEYEKRGQLCD